MLWKFFHNSFNRYKIEYFNYLIWNYINFHQIIRMRNILRIFSRFSSFFLTNVFFLLVLLDTEISVFWLEISRSNAQCAHELDEPRCTHGIRRTWVERGSFRPFSAISWIFFKLVHAWPSSTSKGRASNSKQLGPSIVFPIEQVRPLSYRLLLG